MTLKHLLPWNLSKKILFKTKNWIATFIEFSSFFQFSYEYNSLTAGEIQTKITQEQPLSSNSRKTVKRDARFFVCQDLRTFPPGACFKDAVRAASRIRIRDVCMPGPSNLIY